jgi:hypothetical protein
MTPAQLQKLQAAILSGFSGPDLEQLVRFEMDERLDALVSAGPLRDVAFNLIEWAERVGRVDDLVRALGRARPNNREVQAVVAELLPPAAPAAPGSGPASLDGPRRARLRAALLDQFPTRSGLAMLVDDSLSMNLDAVAAATTNLTETVFELIQWASVSPGKRLRPLLDAAVRERPESVELKELRKELFGAGGAS